MDLVQAPDGEVWAGTQKGVARHAGARFQPLDGPGDPPPSVVIALLATREGLWMGTAMDGLLFRGPKGWRAWTTVQGQPLRRIRQIAEDGRGSIFAVQAGGLVFQLQGDQLVPAPGMPPAPVNALLWAPQGWLAATPQGLWQQTAGTWAQAPEIKGMVLELNRAGDEVLVVADGGLYQGAPGRWRPLPCKGETALRSACPGPGLQGGEAIWACTTRNLYCFENGQARRIQLTPQGDPSMLAKVRVTTGGGRRQVWVASMDGVFRLQPGGWTRLEPGTGPGTSLTYGLTCASDGSTWFGDITGQVHRFDGKAWRSWSLGTESAGSLVVAMCALPGTGGRVAASLSGTGLWTWDGRAWTGHGFGTMPAGTFLGALAPGRHDGEEGLWVGAEPGLHFLSPSRGLVQVASPGKTLRWVLPDPTAPERVLMGGSMDEILAWDGKTLSTFATLRGVRFTTVAAWVPGQEGRLARIGSFSDGVRTLDASGIIVSSWNRSQLPGWPGDGILSLTHDPAGRAWLGTDAGIAVVSPGGSLLATYTSQDGLPANLCTNGALSAGPADVWVSTSRGVAHLAPPAFAQAPAPTLAVQTLSTEAGPFQPGETLRHPARNVTFALDLPLLHREEDARYSITLEGLDTHQGPWTRDSRIVFPTLPTGRYVLQVRAVDPDGRETRPLAIPFRVAPPLWLHPGMFLLYALTLGLAAYALYRTKTARLRAHAATLSAAVDQATLDLRAANERLYHLNDEKNRIIGVAAHDLRNPLSSILLYCDLLQEGLPPEQANDLERIRALGKNMAEMLQGMLDVHAIEEDTAEAPKMEVVHPQGFLMDLQRTHVHRAHRKHIELVPESVGNPQPVLADSRQLQRILDNLVGNAVKYSPTHKRVWIRVVEEPGGTRFEIEDEGPGLTPEDLAQVFGAYARLSAKPPGGEASVGLGLSIARKLAEGMGGTIGVESVHGHGATFWVRLPAAPEEEIPG
jgi:signal transduction histidine kinase/ligand-binding sensor domain-containing protein